MLTEVLGGLPEWLVLGVALGLLASLGAAGVFLVGMRLFPTRARDPAGRFDGDTRRRTEIREYLDGIGEPFAENHPVEDETVAFYLPKRDVAITFDARAFYRIERSGTHAVLVEHEMPGVNLGYRLPFDTPDPRDGDDGRADPTDGIGAGVPGRDPGEAAFATLGLPTGASADEVREAYRAKVKEVHPDHGGDRDEFKRVREAYTAAKQRAEA
ncbi:J domain-containing protein [Halosegnis marinus]|uniref:J domain-containing protein n=1 Tax=Halosegnis marinus TaxID=3034023 RepID=A0ABD5ZRE5_9EURY|nr:J domain-containing protein [Halosegnis sp. DT85]